MAFFYFLHSKVYFFDFCNFDTRFWINIIFTFTQFFITKVNYGIIGKI